MNRGLPLSKKLNYICRKPFASAMEMQAFPLLSA